MIDRIDLLLKEKSITRKKMSEDLGIGKNQLKKWEKGEATPNKAIIFGIADYLGTTPEYLLGETDIKEKPTGAGELSQDNKELFNLCLSLPPEKRQQAYDYLRFLASQSKE